MSVGTLLKFVLQQVDSRYLTQSSVDVCDDGDKEIIYSIYTEITNMFYYRVLLWFSFDLRFTADTTWSVLSRVDVVPPVHHTVPAVSSGAWTQMSYRKN